MKNWFVLWQAESIERSHVIKRCCWIGAVVFSLRTRSSMRFQSFRYAFYLPKKRFDETVCSLLQYRNTFRGQKIIQPSASISFSCLHLSAVWQDAQTTQPKLLSIRCIYTFLVDFSKSDFLCHKIVVAEAVLNEAFWCVKTLTNDFFSTF